MARMRAYERLRNPAWIEAVLDRSGPAVAAAPSRPTRLADCDPRLALPRNQSCYEELGTGAYGTVVQTEDPKIVVKITTDRSEAHFAAASLEYGMVGRGIVRYHYAVRLPVDLHTSWRAATGRRKVVRLGAGDPVYALWRDAAEKVGMIELRRAEANSMDGYSNSADRLSDLSEDWSGAQTTARLWGLVQDARDLLKKHRRMIPTYTGLWAPDQLATEIGRKGLRTTRQAVEAAATLKSAQVALDEMRATVRLSPLAQTLRKFLDHDIVFLDVHEANLGWLQSGAWGITDPGGAIFLTGRYDCSAALLEAPLENPTVYHGTYPAIHWPGEGKPAKRRPVFIRGGGREAHTGPEGPTSGDYGPGVYFATKEADAEKYGSDVSKYDITVTKPLKIAPGKPKKAEIAKIQRGLRLTDEDVECDDGTHPIARMMELIKGVYHPESVRKFLEKLGYDSIFVANAEIRKQLPNAQGDFWIVFDPGNIQALD
jgi:hypothetical protein